MPRNLNPETELTAPTEPLQPVVLYLPHETQIDRNSSAQEVIDDDVKIYNFLINALRTSWQTAFTTEDACRLVDRTGKLLEQRRKALLLPFGAPREKEEKERKISFGPADEYDEEESELRH